MPAYNYFPATYQPYYQNSYMQPQPQMMQQSQMPPTASAVQTSGIIWVSGDSEADAYPLAPNNAVTLWHRTMPIVYFKQADASGKPSMKIYDLVEHKNKPVVENIDFATKDDVRLLETSVKELRAEMRSLKKQMEDSDDAE
jgi:HAMP domain-containing protein